MFCCFFKYLFVYIFLLVFTTEKKEITAEQNFWVLSRLSMLSPNTTLSLLSVSQHFALDFFQVFLKNCKQTTFSQDWFEIFDFCKLNRLFFWAIKIKNCQIISFSSLNFLHVRVSSSCKIKRFKKYFFYLGGSNAASTFFKDLTVLNLQLSVNKVDVVWEYLRSV